MATEVNVQAVYEKGLEDLTSLQTHERLIFVLLDFETLMDMEGWDHFFMYEHSLAHYPELKEWLLKIEDHASFAVLQKFEQCVNDPQALSSADAYERYCSSVSDTERINGPDWRKDYSNLSEQRWGKVAEFLKDRELVLV